jgi:hypothetical protein
MCVYCMCVFHVSVYTCAAPPISFFIVSMLAAGLMLRPPVSKHTPLPTSVTCESQQQQHQQQQYRCNAVSSRVYCNTSSAPACNCTVLALSMQGCKLLLTYCIGCNGEVNRFAHNKCQKAQFNKLSRKEPVCGRVTLGLAASPHVMSSSLGALSAEAALPTACICSHRQHKAAQCSTLQSAIASAAAAAACK